MLIVDSETYVDIEMYGGISFSQALQARDFGL